MRITENANRKLNSFSSEKRKLIYTDHVKETWKVTYYRVETADLLSNIYSFSNIGMVSDAWILYFLVVSGFVNIYTLRQFLASYRSHFPELEIYNFDANGVMPSRALRNRLTELCKNGLIFRFNYDYSDESGKGAPEQEEREFGVGALYAPTTYAIELVNNALESKFKYVSTNMFPKKPQYQLIGHASSSYALSMLVEEVFSSGNRIEFENAHFKSRRVGLYILDNEVKINYPNSDSPADYVAFINGYDALDKGRVTEEMHASYVADRVTVIADYLLHRTQKGTSRVICSVDGVQGFIKFLRLMEASGVEFTENMLERLYFTSEGCIIEEQCLSKSLFYVNGTLTDGSVDVAHCFYEK